MEKLGPFLLWGKGRTGLFLPALKVKLVVSTTLLCVAVLGGIPALPFCLMTWLASPGDGWVA